MTKTYCIFLLLLLTTTTILYAQLSGTYSIPGNYPTIAAAVTALNAAGVGTGGVTFNVAAGHTETLTAPINLTATGYASWPLVFQKSGEGPNPLITAYIGVSNSADTPDGIWLLQGCDYVTIDGIDLYDNNSGLTRFMMEFGYGLFITDSNFGSLYNTIKNCKITLNRNNTCYNSLTQTKGSVGILSINAYSNSAQSEIIPPSLWVTNSYNKFYSNRIENCGIGILLKGYNDNSFPYDEVDKYNDIGGTSAATGNQILNFGGGSTSDPAIGIKIYYQWYSNVSYNNIDNNNGNGINHAYELYGIYSVISRNSTIMISQNNISLKSGSTSSYCNAIYSYEADPGPGSIVNITGNRIADCTNDNIGTGGFTGILNHGNAGTVNINNNILEDCNHAASGTFNGIYNVNESGINTLNISGNIIRNITFTGENGVLKLIHLRSNMNNVTANQIYNISALPTSETIETSICGIHFDLDNYPDNGTYSNNSIYDLSISGSNKAPNSSISGILLASPYEITTKQISNNHIYGFAYTTGRSANLRGIHVVNGETVIANNQIHSFTADGSSSITGINSGTGITHIYNNMIYDLNTPNASNQPSTSAISCWNESYISYNTVYLNTVGLDSSFSNTALYIFYNYSRAYLKNNIFVNASTPGSAGVVAAIWSATETLLTVGTGSDKNIYYCGTPDTRHLIGKFAWDNYQTLAAYKTALADREQSSMTENVPFISVTEPYDLHINPLIITLAEGNAIPIAEITSDYDNEPRDPVNPDIGADEGSFTPYPDPPSAPVYLSPDNGATLVSLDAALSWTAGATGGSPDSFDVYFGTTNPPPFVGNTTVLTYEPALNYLTTYYWKIVAINISGNTEGPVWSFTTIYSYLLGNYNIPGHFPTIDSAVVKLNAVGLGEGGVTFNVIAGHTETLTHPIVISVTGTETSPIVFQKTGEGLNPKITAHTGISQNADTPDGIWILKGCDYITIDGIDLYDPNTENTTTMMEFGFGLFIDATNYGSQHNTIQNCTISLNRYNDSYNTLTQVRGSVGILVINALYGSAQTLYSSTNALYSNSYNRFYGNTISNSGTGIVLRGNSLSSPYIGVNRGNDIGGNSISTGNHILNFGGGNTTNPAIGIKSYYQWDFNISYNTIDNNTGTGVNHTNIIYGIETFGAPNTDVSINYNNISIKSASASSSVYAIYNRAGNGSTTNTVDLNYNRIYDCSCPVVNTGTFAGIYNDSAAGIVNINNNIAENLSQMSFQYFYGILNLLGYANNISNNIIRNITITSNSGLVYLINPKNANNTVTGNEIYNISAIPLSTTLGLSIYAIVCNPNSDSNAGNYSGNIIRSISISGTNTAPNSSINGIRLLSVITDAEKQVFDNQILDLSYTAGTSASLYGIFVNNGLTYIARNKINGLISNGNSSTVKAIYCYNGTTHIYNNIISDLNAAASSLSPSTAAIESTNNCYISYNSVYLSAVAQHNAFTTAAVKIGTNPAYLKNNIFVNKSVHGSTGRTVVVWSSNADNSLVGAGSDNNIYYAGTPGARDLIGLFSSTGYQTLADYKAFMVDKEQNSMTEDVPFVSVTEPYDLHINTDAFTLADGNAIPIVGITTDYDNEPRDSVNPDIGADEFTFNIPPEPENDLAVLHMTGQTHGFPMFSAAQTITVENRGTATQNSYTVRIMSTNGPSVLKSQNYTMSLEPGQSYAFYLNWIPQVDSTYYLYGEVVLAGDENNANNTSTIRQVNVYPWSIYAAIVGENESPTTIGYLPLSFSYKNSLSETIYTATEMQMESGIIEGLIFMNDISENLIEKPVKIWMKNTTATDLSSGWLDFSGYTLAFDDLVSIQTGEYNYVHFALSTPFEYTGGNLAIRVSRPMDTQNYADSNVFYYTEPMYIFNRSRYLLSNPDEINPANPFDNGELTSHIPVTIFIAPIATPVVLTPPDVVITLVDSDIVLNWPEVPGAYCYRIFFSDYLHSWPEYPDAVVYTNSYTVSAPSDVKKFIRVVAVSSYE